MGANEVPEPKPKPGGLLMCCKKLGAEPKCSVYIGDSPSDGLAARAAGMAGVGVLWGANPKERLEGSFDVLVSSVADLRVALLHILSGDIAGATAERRNSAA